MFKNMQVVNNKSMRTALFSTVLYSSSILLSACQPSSEQPQVNALQTVSGEAVQRGTALEFPKDHGTHQQQGIEWWYITANLTAETGETFGLQWTLFRTLIPSKVTSKWWDNNLYFAHFAMQYEQQHVAFERFARASQAKVQSQPFSANIDNWQLKSTQPENSQFLPLQLTANQDNYQVDLTLDNSPISLHGDNGYSQKTQSGHASYYFSYPFLQVNGELTFNGKQYQVTGNAWYDREWSASLLDKGQLGWDWFSLVSDTEPDETFNALHNDRMASSKENTKPKALMLFCIRAKQSDAANSGEVKSGYDNCSGSKIAANGETTTINHQDINLSVTETISLDNSVYPSQWQLEVEGLPAINIESVTKDSRNKLTIPYWEGRIKATVGFSGKGYAELTGH